MLTATAHDSPATRPKSVVTSHDSSATERNSTATGEDSPPALDDRASDGSSSPAICNEWTADCASSSVTCNHPVADHVLRPATHGDRAANQGLPAVHRYAPVREGHLSAAKCVDQARRCGLFRQTGVDSADTEAWSQEEVSENTSHASRRLPSSKTHGSSSTGQGQARVACLEMDAESAGRALGRPCFSANTPPAAMRCQQHPVSLPRRRAASISAGT
jgi:hypothetical protein